MFQPDELTPKQQKLRSLTVFFAKMMAAGVLFQAVLWLRPDTLFLQEALAGLTTHILNLAGLGLQTQGIYILGQDSSFLVTQDCLGWKSMAVFSALIFASSERFREHSKYLFLGLGAIIVANLIRVVTTVYLSHQGIVSFEVIHTFFWKWGLTAVVLILWIYWLKKERSGREN